MLGETLTPKGLDNTTGSLAGALKQLRIAESHASQFAVASVLIIFGLAALGVSFSTIATLVRQRGARLATVTAVVGWFATMCGVIENAAVNYSLAAAGAAHPDATAAKIFYQENTRGLSVVLLALYFFPMHLAIFAPPGSFPGPLLWLPFVAVMLYLSILTWRRAASAGRLALPEESSAQSVAT
jgi:hypothetical protein